MSVLHRVQDAHFGASCTPRQQNVATAVSKDHVTTAPNSSDSRSEEVGKIEDIKTALCKGRGTHIFADTRKQSELMAEMACYYHTVHPKWSEYILLLSMRLMA